MKSVNIRKEIGKFRNSIINILIYVNSFIANNYITKELTQIKTKNIKEYWNRIKDIATLKYPNITFTDFFLHFKQLHEPNDPTMFEVEVEEILRIL